jgi:hypothetical protein
MLTVHRKAPHSNGLNLPDRDSPGLCGSGCGMILAGVSLARQLRHLAIPDLLRVYRRSAGGTCPVAGSGAQGRPSPGCGPRRAAGTKPVRGRPRGGRQPVDGATIPAIRCVAPQDAPWRDGRRCQRLSGVAASVIVVVVAGGGFLGSVAEPAAGSRAVGVVAGGGRDAVGSLLIHRGRSHGSPPAGQAMAVLGSRGCGPGMPRGSSRPWATSSSAAGRRAPGRRPRRAVPPLSAGCRIGRTARTAPGQRAAGAFVPRS